MAYITALAATGVCSLVLLFFWQQLKYRALQREHGCQPPSQYPHKDPFFGVDLFLRLGKAAVENRQLKLLQHLHRELGKTYGWNWWGSRAIHSIEPENIKTVFATKANDWGNEQMRLPSGGPWVGRGFITADGPDYEESHRLLKPSFRRSIISELEPFEACLQELLDQIPKDGSVVDLQVLFSKLYVDTSAIFLFGETLGCVSGNTPAHGKGFLEAFQFGFRGWGIRIVLGPLKFLVPKKKWHEAIVKSHRYADYYIDKALQYREKFVAGEIDTSINGDKQSGILLYNMVEESGDRIFLRNQVLQAVMASQDTTSNLIGNVFFLLARHPDIWQKVRKEVLLVDGDLDFNRLMGMMYLQKVITEALRIYPVFPTLGRAALRDTILPVGGGPDGRSPIFASKGTRFDTSFYTLHHDPEIWGPDAEEFKPDRWDTVKPNAWEYVPFGGGMHTCLGQQKATLETSYIVARMMQEFQKIESRDDRPWQGHTALTARNANGCLVSLTPA